MKSIGELLAERSKRNRVDIHNRLTLFPLEPREQKEPDPVRTTLEYNALLGKLDQVIAKNLWLERKLNEHLDKKFKKDTNTYTITNT